MNIQVLLFLVAVLSAFVKFLVIPYLRDLKLWFWVQRAVNAVEQVIKEEGMGEIKKEEVIRFIVAKFKFKIDADDLDILIEAAVKELDKIKDSIV